MNAEIPEPARILIVDDEAPVLDLCRRALADGGAAIETASGAEEALALLRRGAFDIIITDIQMNDPRAGVNLTEEARSRWPETDILIITGNPSLETAIPTLKTGAADYLIKPFSMPQLLAAVNRLLAMRRLRRESEREKLLYRKLAEDYAVLQKVERLKAGLLGRVSHELRTPVTIARAAAEIIKDELSPSGRDSGAKLDGALRRMQATVDDLLLFAQTQDDGFQLNKSQVDLWPVLEQLLAGYRPLWEERGLQAGIGLEGERRPLFADAELMEAAFSRLLLNAIRFNRKGGSISVLARYGPQETSFAFTDTGEGIPLEEQNRIFDGLYQVADYLTRKVGGLGVGLAVVRRIVEAHKGSVSVKSAPGNGSIFTILLPKQTPT
ncbi:MAG: response regulator [Elusimicrobia bacterium]|nr:response regulator [Elusimicrobiota bacterium]